MKYIMIWTYTWDMSKDRILIGNIKRRGVNYYITLGYLLEFGTFDEKEDFLLLDNASDSIQIRPKAIYKNSKGYYIKDEKRTYINEQKEEIEKYIEKAKQYLERRKE